MPQYFDPFSRIADMPGRRSLHSAGTSHLLVSPVRLSAVLNRAFPVVGPRIWNDLLADVMSAKSLSILPAAENPSLLEIIPAYFLNTK